MEPDTQERTISQLLAQYVATMEFSNLPSDAVEKTKLCVLDTIGCMLAGSQDRVGITIAAHVARHGRPGPSTVFGRPETVAPAAAALANGTAAHVLDWDDGHRPSGDHIGGVVVPAALAMAQATGASGRDLLLAVALGYDAMGRVGESVALPHTGDGHFFHGNGTTGVFGSAAAAGKLLGLDVGQLTNAFGIAGDGASGFREFRPTGADVKSLHDGRAGQTGITAAYLAAEGFQGSTTILEGRLGFCGAMTTQPRPELIAVDLGERFAVVESGFKLYPCVGTLHLPIEAALVLRAEHGLRPDSIERVRIALPDSVREDYASDRVGRQRPPATPGNARFSMSYAVAAALCDGEVTPRQFTRAKLADACITALERLVEFVSDPEVEAIFAPQKSDARFYYTPCAVEVESGGRRYRKVVRTPAGYDPHGRGLSETQVIEKFRSAAVGALSPTAANRVVEWAMGLDRDDKVTALPRMSDGMHAAERS